MSGKAILVFVNEDVAENKLKEFRSLAEVAGYKVIDFVIQRRIPDSRFYIGPGKLNELKEVVKKKKVDILITYHELKPKQHFNLEKELGIKVMDRVELILEIFDKRAGSKEAKLQIELAKLKHELPRIKEYIRLAKIGEQIGFHGAGEYAVEAYYRYVRQRITIINKELKEIKSKKTLTILKRKDYGLPEIVLTGYTMAGKTTLFNRLTKDFKYRDGKPFATLDTYSHIVDIDGIKAILTDTIGFIDDLPPLLVEAFYATIQEIVHSDLILLVIDVSDLMNEFRRKFESSLKILNDLSIPLSKVLPVLNKIDLVDNYSEIEIKKNLVLQYFDNCVEISAEKGFGIDKLKKVILSKLPNYVNIKLYVNAQDLPEWIYKICKVELLDSSIYLTVHKQNLDKILNWAKSNCVRVEILENTGTR